MKCENCELEMAPEDRGVAITDYRCFGCSTKVTKLWSLPSRISRAAQMFEGKEMVDKVINILTEYHLVTPTTETLTEGITA